MIASVGNGLVSKNLSRNNMCWSVLNNFYRFSSTKILNYYFYMDVILIEACLVPLYFINLHIIPVYKIMKCANLSFS